MVRRRRGGTQGRDVNGASISRSPDLAGAELAIEVRSLSRHYGDVLALDDVSFTAYAGEVFGLLGPNGAGKTTLLETIEGLRPVESGSIAVCGFDVVTQTREVWRRIGVHLQDSEYIPSLSVSDLVSLFADLHGVGVDTAALLARSGLGGLEKRLPNQLSGGQRQRLGIALALLHGPSILILDEPTSGLDPRARERLKQLIRELKDDGTTVLLSTHYLPDAEDLCDRVMVLDRGKVVALGTLAELTLSAETLDGLFLRVTADD